MNSWSEKTAPQKSVLACSRELRRRDQSSAPDVHDGREGLVVGREREQHQREAERKRDEAVWVVARALQDGDDEPRGRQREPEGA